MAKARKVEPSESLRKYRIECAIEFASGRQVWEIEAASKEAALALWATGDYEVLEEEIEVGKVSEPVVSEVDA